MDRLPFWYDGEEIIHRCIVDNLGRNAAAGAGGGNLSMGGYYVEYTREGEGQEEDRVNASLYYYYCYYYYYYYR